MGFFIKTVNGFQKSNFKSPKLQEFAKKVDKNTLTDNMKR